MAPQCSDAGPTRAIAGCYKDKGIVSCIRVRSYGLCKGAIWDP